MSLVIQPWNKIPTTQTIRADGQGACTKASLPVCSPTKPWTKIAAAEENVLAYPIDHALG